MKLTELIETLSLLKEQNGNIEIWLSHPGSRFFEDIGDIYLGPDDGKKFALITDKKRTE